MIDNLTIQYTSAEGYQVRLTAPKTDTTDGNLPYYFADMVKQVIRDGGFNGQVILNELRSAYGVDEC